MHWTHIWNTALEWVTLHPSIAYPAIFFIALSESLALVGLLIPGTALMIGIGALVGSGALSLQATLIMAMTGAVAGDGISFWLGKHFHQDIKKYWPFRKHPQLLVRGEKFFHRHGGKSIFFGRFVGPVRPIIPVIAGMLDMPLKNFLLVNILSAIGWAFAYLIPGVLLGSSLTLIGAVSMRLSLLILLLLLLFWLAFWLSKKMFDLLGFLGPKEEQLLLPVLCISLGLAGWLFLGVLEDVVSLDPLVRADQSIYQFLTALRTPWGDQIMVAVTEFGDSLMNAAILIVVLLVLLCKRQFRAAAYWVIAALGGAGLVELFKWLLHRPRPIDIYQGIFSWSFPSGHTTMSVVLFTFLAILLVRSFSSKWRWLPFAIAIGLSLLIAFSRLYLGAHWLSDVLGGLSLGWAWATLLGIFYLRQPAVILPRRPVISGLVCVLIFVGAWHIQRHHTADLSRYQIQDKIQTLNFTNWQTNGWQQLSAWRVDFGGEQEQPLILQWAGDPEKLAEKLYKQGWTAGSELKIKQLLFFFVPNVKIRKLPLLPQLADGRRERLILTRYQDNRRLVLRLWPSKFKTSEPDLPLWVGSLDTEQAKAISAAGLLTLPLGDRNYSGVLHYLTQSVPQLQSSHVTRPDHLMERVPGSNSQVLLLWDETAL
jgi:membrane protein DedA with SNARE-associated domain/membrane-associated phospholipid phosphatase